MSMTPEIAQKILEGMRINLKQAILPQLKNVPYPTAQAVSSYVLLKTLSGYTSHQFRIHILKSNEEMREIFQNARSMLCDASTGVKPGVATLCAAIEKQLAKKVPSDDPFSNYQQFMDLLTQLIQAIWGKAQMDAEVKQALRLQVNRCLRNQLDREIALFT